MNTENTNISADTTKQEHDRPALVKKIGKTTYRVHVEVSMIGDSFPKKYKCNETMPPKPQK